MRTIGDGVRNKAELLAALSELSFYFPVWDEVLASIERITGEGAVWNESEIARAALALLHTIPDEDGWALRPGSFEKAADALEELIGLVNS